jgi:uncharacterized protein
MKTSGERLSRRERACRAANGSRSHGAGGCILPAKHTRADSQRFAATEFASVVARRVRTGDVSADEARRAFAAFDLWTARVALREETMTVDIRAAETFLRRLDLTLRTADALNIAIAQRISAGLVTFDTKMAANARVLGVPVVAA